MYAATDIGPVVVIASASVFANGVDHCLSFAAGVYVEDQRKPRFAAFRTKDCDCRQLYRFAVWRKTGGIALMSMWVTGAP